MGESAATRRAQDSRRRRVWRVRLFGRETPALVGVVRSLRDWDIVRNLGWYRIPVRSAPEGLEKVRYLAFYQTSVFRSEKWRVNWYAKVKGMSVAYRRVLLPEEPLHPRADIEYYRIDIEELRPLPRPIPSRSWRRIVFIPTSLERLLRAEEINDLFRTSPIEDRLYFTLRDAGFEPERQYPVREEEGGRLLDIALFCSDGKLDIECDGERYHSGREKAEADRARDNALTGEGWRILRFSGTEILKNPERCLATVKRTVRRMGGEEGQREKSEGRSEKAEGRRRTEERSCE